MLGDRPERGYEVEALESVRSALASSDPHMTEVYLRCADVYATLAVAERLEQLHHLLGNSPALLAGPA